VLLVALNERLPDTYKLLPPAGQPGPDEGWRRSLRQMVTDRRVARHTGPPLAALAEWLADRQRLADRMPPGAMPTWSPNGGWGDAARWATDPDPAAGHQERDEPPDRSRCWQCEERDREDRRALGCRHSR
jgi:hypothetical protein